MINTFVAKIKGFPPLRMRHEIDSQNIKQSEYPKIYTVLTTQKWKYMYTYQYT